MTKKEKKQVKELLKECKVVKNWDGKGYTESYKDGYQKANEQFERSLKNLKNKTIK